MSNNQYLRLISGNEIITIPACKGGKKANIYCAKKTFPGGIDRNFSNYGCDTKQSATMEIRVQVYEMYKRDANFKTLFGVLSSNLKSLAFESQEQIAEFCKKHKQWLRKGGFGTFFLFTEIVEEEEKFFVASARFDSGGLRACIDHLLLTDGVLWYAGNTPRVVVRETKPLEL